MKRNVKQLLAQAVGIILAASLLLTGIPAFVTDAEGASVWPDGPEIISETAILMDADTGAVLYDKDMDRVLYPASTAKIMTCLLALENGSLEDQVTMTETGVFYAQTGSSNLKTQVGEVFTLEQLLYGTMLKSANDMATQVGAYIGGTIEQFVDMMNARAEQIGCTHTHYTNACGMPDPAMVTTAHDLALISKEALKNETFRKITGTHAYTIPPTNLTPTARDFTNHNPLLVNPDYAYPGIIGGKTGYTDSALNTLVTFVSQDDRVLIAATLMASDATFAANDHRALYDYGFNCFENVEAIPASYVEEGGLVSLPDGTDPSMLTEWDSGNEDGTLKRTFVLGEREVGYAVLTDENAEAYEKEKAEAEEKKREMERAAAEAAEKEKAKENEETEVTPAPEEDTAVTAEDDSDSYLGKLGYFLKHFREYLTPMNIALAVLALLVLIFFIIMIGAAVSRRNRRKRRRRRRR